MSTIAEDYKDLLQSFLSGHLTPQAFQAAYLEKFKGEDRALSEELFQLLDGLFGDVDAFCPDPGLLVRLQTEVPDFYLDEASLRKRVQEVSSRLVALAKQPDGTAGNTSAVEHAGSIDEPAAKNSDF